MAKSPITEVIQQLRRLACLRNACELPDGQLLERYLTQHDEAAFEILLQRHGPMVWRVCRGVLREPHDAEDAFQATFLVFARKAGSIGERALLAPWLNGVAYRVALRARTKAARWQRGRRQDLDMLPAKPSHDADQDELGPVLHQELNRLPAKYRSPIVLCYLQGQTHEKEIGRASCRERV